MSAEDEANGSGTASIVVTPDQFATLLETFKSSHERLESRFGEFKAEIQRSQDEAAAKAVKRARYEKPYAFKKKGNEEQAAFNSRISESMAEAETELTGVAASPALERAQAALEKGKKLIAERQKLIRIADRSDLGWGVVAEYTADELAEDSDDEKRLEKAEKAAERKALKKKKKRADQQPPPKKYGPRQFAPAAGGLPSAGLQAAFPGRRFEPALSTFEEALVRWGRVLPAATWGTCVTTAPRQLAVVLRMAVGLGILLNAQLCSLAGCRVGCLGRTLVVA